MKINSKLKNFIILVSILALFKGYFSSNFACRNKDYKDKYGVYLVFDK